MSDGLVDRPYNPVFFLQSSINGATFLETIMKRKKTSSRNRRGSASLLRLLKDDKMPPGQSLKSRGLATVCLKDLYTPSVPEDHECPVPWNCMSEDDRKRTLDTLDKLSGVMQNRIIRPGKQNACAIPKEILFLGPTHIVKGNPGGHAPLPQTVPSSTYDLLTDDQKGLLMDMNAHTSLRRFLRRAQGGGWWDEATVPKLKQAMSESVGLGMHLFDRLSTDCFVVSFRIDCTQRFYVAMAFRPKDGDRPGDKVNLLGRQGPYSVYFFTCSCR